VDRDQMLAREQTSWDAFVQAVDALPEDRRDVQGVVPGWSAKDLAWHNGYWAGYVADVLEAIAAGQPGLPDQDWDALNEQVIVDGRQMSWDEIWSRSDTNRTRARAALRALPDLTDAAVEEFEGETYEHYEEHTAEVVAFAPV
jgi:Mycothiol maleylpyruvate isomerase N-terminal domain